MQPYDAIILGAGAAGLMCALTAGHRGRRVLLLDHADRVGSKILISGGGRCNFTNIYCAPDRFLSSNPHFAKSALSRFTPADFIDMVERYGIAYHEKKLGQLFCDNSAKEIVRMLEEECAKAKVDVRTHCHISEITHNGQFHAHTSAGTFSAAALVIATGGPSIPKMGASDFAYRLARQFGLKVKEPRPALVPLTFGDDMRPFCGLAGVSTDIDAHCGNQFFREAALFTHRGVSGPAILQISSYWRPGNSIRLNFVPDINLPQWLHEAKARRPKAEIASLLSEILPNRLAVALAEQASFKGRIGETSDKMIHEKAERLTNWQFHPTGTEGYAKAEVTVGGIDTAGLSSKTMEARKIPGLYVIGEAVDVTGWLGGYNFQWAWASGWSAGQAI